ncbi:hypothetical protein BCIN_11g01460 [Botrytis cinerea B05.10]|uniref:Uncharacterized protein n=1 Tax=Botryotinia fuckeliana (strain B05.10) TaxID=332648 RepID=A0A384JWB0_BOTFB|nr:hypothetical protein BCIN_11g01460 [Botrytis cinerea B05.10]ATZ54818.1 hypothetical protein BCIN_11g01460 [Botrytis cinerea B05.10]
MIRFQRNPDITQITTMPSKRNFFEMSGDAANTKAHPLDLVGYHQASSVQMQKQANQNHSITD